MQAPAASAMEELKALFPVGAFPDDMVNVAAQYPEELLRLETALIRDSSAIASDSLGDLDVVAHHNGRPAGPDVDISRCRIIVPSCAPVTHEQLETFQSIVDASGQSLAQAKGGRCFYRHSLSSFGDKCLFLKSLLFKDLVYFVYQGPQPRYCNKLSRCLSYISAKLPVLNTFPRRPISLHDQAQLHVRHQQEEAARRQRTPEENSREERACNLRGMLFDECRWRWENKSSEFLHAGVPRDRIMGRMMLVEGEMWGEWESYLRELYSLPLMVEFRLREWREQQRP